MGPMQRLRAAWKAFRTTEDYTASTIRPYEATVPDRSYERSFDEFSHKYSKYVKVCVALRAQSLAGLKWGVARRVRGGQTSKVWATKRIGADKLKRLRKDSGQLAAKRFELSDEYEAIVDPNHPATLLFDRVNGQMNGFDLFEQTEMMLCLTGNFYWMIVTGANKWPIELWPMFPQFVTVKPNRMDMVGSYLYGTGTENEIEIMPEQVVHFKRPNPLGDPIYGMGDLATIITEAELSSAFSEFALKFIDNGAHPGVIINVPGANPKQRQEIVTEFRKQAEGVRNAARSVVLSMPKEAVITTLAQGSKEAGFLGGQSEEVCKKAICAAFGVPVGLVDMEDFSLASGEVAAPHFQQLTVMPAARRVADKINERVMPMFREAMGDETLVFYFENPVKGDLEKERTAAVSLYGSQVVTKNEARRMAGFEPVEDGDDFSDTGIPMADLGDSEDGSETDAETPATTEGIAADPNADVQATALNGAQVTALSELASSVATGQLPIESAIALALAAFPLVPPETINAIFNPLRNFTPEPTADQVAAENAASQDTALEDDGDGGDVAAKAAARPAYHKSLRKLWASGEGCGCKSCVRTKAATDLPTKGDVTTLDAAVGPWLDALTLDVLKRLPKTAAELQTFDLFGGSVSAADLITSTRGPLEGVARAGVEIGFRDVGVASPTLEVASERVREYIAQAQKPFVQSVTASVDAQIRSVLERAINEGVSTPEMVQQVAQVMGNNATTRASLIANTEAANIYNGAKELAWEAAGNVAMKEWLLSGNPCPICVAVYETNRIVPLGEAFVPLGATLKTSEGVWINDYKPIMGPTAHPRCRCGMAPVIGGKE